jgi:hypothetical protein
MKAVILTVSLDIQGPILSKSSTAARFGIDAAAARDAEGRLYLPYSLVKGKVKEAWQELQSVDNVSQLGYQKWLGKNPPPQGTSDWESERGRLFFTDFKTPKRVVTDLVYTRSSLDDDTLSVDEGALFALEYAVKPGETATFQGEVTFLSSSDEEITQLKQRLEFVFNWLMHVGSGFSIGLGQITSVRLEEMVVPLSSEETNDYNLLTLTFEQPFCIAKPRKGTDSNLFESSDVITGSVVRGALATMLKTLENLGVSQEISEQAVSATSPYALLAKHFNTIAFRHAYPRDLEKGKPVVPPHSLVKSSNGTLYDVALADKPLLINNEAVTFQTDWKDFSVLGEALFHFVQPNKEIRVRTAIDEKTGTSKETALFSYESVLPQGYEWQVGVDFSGIPDIQERTSVQGQLKGLLQTGLFSIGKTKARANVRFEYDTREAETLQPVKGVYILTLQSKALLFEPRQFNNDVTLSDVYKNYFSEISDGQLELVRFFATQSLSGGYLISRLQSKRNRPYYPFVLTDEGSVFVLRVKDEQALEKLEGWLKYGLPLSETVKVFYGETWRENPYIPEDGYGAIAINLPCHTNIKAPGEQV